MASWNLFPEFGWFGPRPGHARFVVGKGVSRQVQLVWRDRDGGQIGTIGAPGRYGQITLSPDERNVALEIFDPEGQYDLWVMDVARGVTSRVTATPGDERDPSGPRTAAPWHSSQGGTGPADLRRKGLRASEAETVLTDSPDEDVPESWSSDGGRSRSSGGLPRTNRASGLCRWAEGRGGADPDPRLQGRRAAAVAGRPVAGLRLGRVRARRGLRGALPTRRGSAARLRGRRRPAQMARRRQALFFTAGNSRLMAVEIRATGDRLEVDLPVELFEIRGLQGTGYDDYAVSADGQRFLVKLAVEEDVEPQLHIVTNWTSLLE